MHKLRFSAIFYFVLYSMFSFGSENFSCNRIDSQNGLVFPIAKESSEVIRVFSYNVRGESHIDQEQGNSWQLRKYKIQYLIRCYEPDLIALQEVSKSYMQDILSLFSEYYCIAFDISNKDKDVAMLIHKDRFIVEDIDYFWLSENPWGKTIQQQAPWEGKKTRIVIYAQLFDCQTKKKFIAVATHFDSTGMESRINSAKVLAEQVKFITHNLPVVLVGDFNFIMDTPVIAKKSQESYEYILNNTELKDIRDVSSNNHFGPDGTWIGWRYDKYAAPLGRIGERLDHIFVDKFSALKEGVLNLKVNADLNELCDSFHNDFNSIEYPSDHLPVIADLLLVP
jgi:endonuclease/exonuclease/phosphatase family metal-dependent hydrolase